MSEQRDLVGRHVQEILAEAQEKNIPTDLIGRELLNQAVAVFQQNRSVEDIASELVFTAEHLDPDTEFTFMRP